MVLSLFVPDFYPWYPPRLCPGIKWFYQGWTYFISIFLSQGCAPRGRKTIITGTILSQELSRIKWVRYGWLHHMLSHFIPQIWSWHTWDPKGLALRLNHGRGGMARLEPGKRRMARLEPWEGGVAGNKQWKKEIVDKS